MKKSTPKQEHVKLCWKLIAYKVAYYQPESVHEQRKADYEIDDHTYDAYELRYLTLCRELGEQNTLVHKSYPGFEDMLTRPHDPMMEIDISRPSVQLVMMKLQSPKSRNRK